MYVKEFYLYVEAILPYFNALELRIKSIRKKTHIFAINEINGYVVIT